jgi:threonine dehydrogenase-like Zn-dependent dehydrogenase
MIQQRKVLILQAPQQVRFQEETLPELQPHQILVRSMLSTFKHGTEMTAYFGSSSVSIKHFDPKLRVFVETPEANRSHFYPRPMGNMTVGVVEQVGEAVTAFAVGDRVFGWLPIANWHLVVESQVRSLGNLTPERALCVDPASFALGGVLDGGVRAGEQVLIVGLGAIGLLAIQYCKLHGAVVYASSSFTMRRQLAVEYGADVVLDSAQIGDLGLEIKQVTGEGVDVAIECSGKEAQLHQAIRATRQCGRVVCVGFYSGGFKNLNLGEEFYHNRLSLLASLPALSWNNPVRTEPKLYARDLQRQVIEDFETQRLSVAGMLQPIYSFEDAEEALETISKCPQEVLKVLIKY